MRLRVVLLLCAIIIAVSIVIYVIPVRNSSKQHSQQNEQGAQQDGRRNERTHKTVDGVELWIAWTEEHDSGIGRYRVIFAFMENKYFNEETLRRIFTRMAEEYPQYPSLSIKIYTDEEKLAWAIDDYRTYREYITPPKPTEEQKPRNHFEAHYSRIVWPNGLREEGFAYTPDRTKKDLVEIKLKP